MRFRRGRFRGTYWSELDQRICKYQAQAKCDLHVKTCTYSIDQYKCNTVCTICEWALCSQAVIADVCIVLTVALISACVAHTPFCFTLTVVLLGKCCGVLTAWNVPDTHYHNLNNYSQTWQIMSTCTRLPGYWFVLYYIQGINSANYKVIKQCWIEMFSNYTPKLTFVSGCAQTDSHHPVSLPSPPPSPPYSLQSHTAAMGRLPTPVCSTGLCPRGREVQSHQAEPLVMGAGGNAKEQSQAKSRLCYM